MSLRIYLIAADTPEPVQFAVKGGELETPMLVIEEGDPEPYRRIGDFVNEARAYWANRHIEELGG